MLPGRQAGNAHLVDVRVVDSVLEADRGRLVGVRLRQLHVHPPVPPLVWACTLEGQVSNRCQGKCMAQMQILLSENGCCIVPLHVALVEDSSGCNHQQSCKSYMLAAPEIKSRPSPGLRV